MLDERHAKIIIEYIDNIEYRVKEIKQYIAENGVKTYDDLFTIENTLCRNLEVDLDSLEKVVLESYDLLEDE